MALMTRHPGAKTYRGPSPGLWKKVDALIAADPFAGLVYQEDFATVSATIGAVTSVTAEWVVTSLVGTAVVSGGANTPFGTMLLDPGATTATHGASAQLQTGAFLPAAGRGIYYETLVKLAALGTASTDFAQGFFGLADKGGTVLSGAALNVNGIGFTLGADGVFQFALKGSGAVATKATAVTATAGTWYHLGFAVHQDTGICNAWVNNVKDNISSAVTAKAFTKAQVDTIVTDHLTPTYVIRNVATARALCEVDWVKAAQIQTFKVR